MVITGLLLAACGSDSGSPNPPERSGAGEESAAQACGDVVVTPNSGDGLFAVEAQGISCDDATEVLKRWGKAGYPGGAPEGFACETLSTTESGSGRLRCTEQGTGGVLEFSTGV